MKTKRCPKCKGTYPVEAFNRNASRADGRAPYCRDCSANYQNAKHAGVEQVSYIRPPTPEEMRKRGAARRALEAMRDEKMAPDYF